MVSTWKPAAAAVATVPLLGLLAACGGSSGAGEGSPSLDITAPADGAHVGSSFPVRWSSSVRLGEPDTGRDHVHVFVDGNASDYTVVGGHDFTIKGLSPGEHTVDVTLQHADHSSAGAEDEVSVVVGQGAPPSDAGSTDSGSTDSGSTDSGGSGGYGY